MAAFQRKIGFVMIELGMIEFRDLGITTFVIGMTCLAFLGRLDTAVVASFPVDVLANFLVAIGTKPGLRRLVEFLVAFFAAPFFLCMRLDDFARH